MHSIKKIIRTIISLLVVVIVWNMAASFLYAPYNELNVFRKIDFEKENGNIEVVLCGTSLAMQGFNTKVFDEKLGCNTFNFATSNQDIESTSYLLRQLAEDNPIKMLVLNVSGGTLKSNKSENEDFVRKKAVWDAYFTLDTKLCHFFDLFSEKEYEKVLVYSYNVSDSNLLNVEKIGKNIYNKVCVKNPEEYKPEKYISKGYIEYSQEYDGKIPTQGYIERKKYNPDEIDEENVYYLQQILSFCAEEGIRVLLVTTPVSPTMNSLLGSEDDMKAYYASLAKEYGAEYFYYSDEVLQERFQDADFWDWQHLNKYGATLLSNDLCDYLAGEGIKF